MFTNVAAQAVINFVFLAMLAGSALTIHAPLQANGSPDGKQPELVKVCEGLVFPEGPAYDGQGHLYVSNCNADYITRVGLDGTVQRRWMTASSDETPFTFHKTNGMTCYKDGSLVVCDQGRKAIIWIHPDRRCELYAEKCDGVPFKGPNDLAFDPKGNLYFTDPAGSDDKNPIGCVYVVARGTRAVHKVAEGLAFPNGLAFTADGKSLYLCESYTDRILRYAVQPNGALGAKEVIADLSSDGKGYPDGMAVDVQGNLWIAHCGRRDVLLIDPQGKILRKILLPKEDENSPTNLEFAGKDLKTLYITDPGTNALWKMRADVAGLPLFCCPPRKK